MTIEYILSNIFRKIDKNLVEVIIWYGNKPGNDFDILIVLNIPHEYNIIKFDDIDITYIGEDQTEEMIKGFNPLITEPILNGEIIFGDKGWIDRCLPKLVSLNITDVQRHLLEWTDKSIVWFKEFYSKKDFVSSEECLFWGLSFLIYLQEYTKQQKVFTFSELIDKDYLLKFFRDSLKSNKKITKEYLESYFNLVKSRLTEAKSLVYSD